MTKLMSAEGIAETIASGCTLAFPGNLTIMVADELLKALEHRFLATGSPRDLTVFEPCNAVLGPGTGVERFAHADMLKRIVCSAFPLLKDCQLAALIDENLVEAYNFPMGVLYNLTREIGARRPGLFTEVGLGTFVDPRQAGGKLNARTQENLVDLIEVNGQELLFYRAFPIDVAFLKATSADQLGNLSFEREPLSLGALALAIAAKASGGKVYAQVERIVDPHALPLKSVLVPGAFVDGIVVAPDAPQSGVSRFDPTITGELRAEHGRAPVPDGPVRVIVSRAATMLRKGWLANLGVGIPTQLPALLREAGLDDCVTFTTEHGAIGGLPRMTPTFGAHANAQAVIDPPDLFNFYTAGGLDITFLGLAQADAAGNVNVSRFGGRTLGVGGFIDITARTPRIVICGTLAADGAVVGVESGAVVIRQEGRAKKLVRQVEQITLNGRRCLNRGQRVTLVTERGVFTLTEAGWLLVEVPPGIDPARHVAPMMEFALRISPELKIFDPMMTSAPGAAFNAWLGDQVR